MAHNIGKVLRPCLEDHSGLILRKKPCRSQWVGSGASLVRIGVAGLCAGRFVPPPAPKLSQTRSLRNISSSAQPDGVPRPTGRCDAVERNALALRRRIKPPQAQPLFARRAPATARCFAGPASCLAGPRKRNQPQRLHIPHNPPLVVLPSRHLKPLPVTWVSPRRDLRVGYHGTRRLSPDACPDSHRRTSRHIEVPRYLSARDK